MDSGEANLTSEIAKEVAKNVPVKEIYDDVLKATTNSVGEVVSLIPRAINVAFLPLHQWILNREYNINETKKLLEKKLENVKPESIVSPETYVAIPAIQSISYCMDNEELREMYANLLAGSMIKETKDNVHPSFVEIIKQLSPDEAKLLKSIYKYKYHPYITLKRKNKGERGSIELIEYFTLIAKESKCDVVENLPKYLENLERLKLITIYRESFLTTPGTYDDLKKHIDITKYTSIVDDEMYEYEVRERFFKISNYGESFCLSCVI